MEPVRLRCRNIEGQQRLLGLEGEDLFDLAGQGLEDAPYDTHCGGALVKNAGMALGICARLERLSCCS